VNLFPKLLLLVGSALLISAACWAENKQQEGEMLIKYAEEVSNLRTPDAHPFRLLATFRLLGNGATAEQGSYMETWASPTSWRRESVLGAFHRTEVGGEKTRWILDSVEEVPGKAGQLGTLMHVGSIRHELHSKVAAIREEIVQGVQARCIELKGGTLGNETFCIDAQRGVLLEQKSPTLWMGTKSEYSCIYGQYEPFAGRMYPHHIECREGVHPGIEVTVNELASIPSPDSSLFAAPAGAKELANCPGKLQAPRALQTPDPVYPSGQNQPASPEVLWLMVDRDGKPRDPKVVRSVGKAFDKPALEAVSRWMFKPATCDGEPTPVPISVEVAFRKW